ncbi:MAG TPA: hypothetical protein EYP86_02780 [Candidatus Altiarchaeales archaeon]|nr:hypothetical protein [Candidatus Altiarchaeales archaeon]
MHIKRLLNSPIRYIVIALLIIVCVGVRFYFIPTTNLSERELSAYKAASQESIRQTVIQMKDTAEISPLFFLTTHFWLKLHTPTEYYLRLISVLFSLLSLLLFYRTTRLFLSQIHALVIAILTYFSAYHWYYAYQFTYHSMLLFLITLNTYAFFSLLTRNSSPSQKWLFIVSGIFALHTHLFVLFCFIGQFCALLCMSQKDYRISKFPMQNGFAMGDMIITVTPDGKGTIIPLFPDTQLGDVIIYNRDKLHPGKEPIIHRVIGIVHVKDWKIESIEGTLACLTEQDFENKFIPYIGSCIQGNSCPYADYPNSGTFRFYLTKGDNNPMPDQCGYDGGIALPVNEKQLTARGWIRLPYIGWLKLILNSILSI